MPSPRGTSTETVNNGWSFETDYNPTRSSAAFFIISNFFLTDLYWSIYHTPKNGLPPGPWEVSSQVFSRGQKILHSHINSNHGRNFCPSTLLGSHLKVDEKGLKPFGKNSKTQALFLTVIRFCDWLHWDLVLGFLG